MEITYEDKKVEALFEDFNLMAKTKDKVLTKLIKKRYDQLKAAETFEDYLQTNLGKPHLLKGNKAGCYGISVNDHIRLIIKPKPKDSSTESLKICTQITLKGVEDYHGNKITSYIP